MADLPQSIQSSFQSKDKEQDRNLFAFGISPSKSSLEIPSLILSVKSLRHLECTSTSTTFAGLVLTH